ncbi:MAG: ProQ/FinO family protein [Thiohalocapsa sp.]|nr:ProQ/FinO family protein [Thiohalocapsa sp.]
MTERQVLTLKAPRKRLSPAVSAAVEDIGAEREARGNQPRDAEILRRAAVWLRGEYPVLFAEPKPLAIGVGRELARLRPEGVSHTGIRRALRAWTRRTGYLRALAADGSRRIGLDGADAGPVSDGDRQHAREALAERAAVDMRDVGGHPK